MCPIKRWHYPNAKQLGRLPATTWKRCLNESEKGPFRQHFRPSHTGHPS